MRWLRKLHMILAWRGVYQHPHFGTLNVYTVVVGFERYYVAQSQRHGEVQEFYMRRPWEGWGYPSIACGMGPYDVRGWVRYVLYEDVQAEVEARGESTVPTVF